MITAQTIFNQMVRELGRMPKLEEFLNRGYSRSTYYKCKKDYKAEGEING